MIKNKINREFDVVTNDELNHLVTKNVVDEELKQTQDLNIKFYKLGFIAKSGFPNDIDRNKFICFELKDFYNC